MREKPGSLFQPRWREVSPMQGGVSSGAITQRKKANLLWVLLLTRSIPLVFFSSSSQRGAACALVSGIRVSSDAKHPSPPEPPLVAGYAIDKCQHLFIAVQVDSQGSQDHG